MNVVMVLPPMKLNDQVTKKECLKIAPINIFIDDEIIESVSSVKITYKLKGCPQEVLSYYPNGKE